MEQFESSQEPTTEPQATRPADLHIPAEAVEPERLIESENDKLLNLTLDKVRSELSHDIRTGEPVSNRDARIIDHDLENYQLTVDRTIQRSATDPRIRAAGSLLGYIQARQLQEGYESDQNSSSDARGLAREMNNTRVEAHQQAALALADLRPDLFDSSDAAGKFIDELVRNYSPADIAQRIARLGIEKKFK